MKYRISGNEIELAGGQHARFGSSVLSAVDLGDRLVVLLDPAPSNLSENVYAIDASGRVLWRVEEIDLPHGRPPYTGVYLVPEGLALYNRSGVEVIVDAGTGRVLRTDLIR